MLIETVGKIKALQGQKDGLCLGIKQLEQAKDMLEREMAQLIIDTHSDDGWELFFEDVEGTYRRHWTDIKFGTWSCETSPTERCVYNVALDPMWDDCIFCHEPHERK